MRSDRRNRRIGSRIRGGCPGSDGGHDAVARRALTREGGLDADSAPGAHKRAIPRSAAGEPLDGEDSCGHGS